jgi:hypothetical protein
VAICCGERRDFIAGAPTRYTRPGLTGRRVAVVPPVFAKVAVFFFVKDDAGDDLNGMMNTLVTDANSIVTRNRTVPFYKAVQMRLVDSSL